MLCVLFSVYSRYFVHPLDRNAVYDIIRKMEHPANGQGMRQHPFAHR